jgi:beta-glucuronidase
VKELNGLWNFRADFSDGRNQGFCEKWFSKPLEETGPVIPMAVPSSFNDLTQDASLRDYVGWVWYDRTVNLPPFAASGSTTRYVLRFESAHYYTTVWLNGEELGLHNGGHLPFEFQVSFQSEMRITVAVNNTLTPTTLPCGSIEYKNSKPYPKGFFEQKLQFDFFNYAGIHRSVSLYTTPSVYISDINTNTFPDPHQATAWLLSYNIEVGGSPLTYIINTTLYDPSGSKVVGHTSGPTHTGTINVPNASLWWPWSMNPSQNTTYRYRFEVKLIGKTSEGVEVMDQYTLRVGFRNIRVTESKFLINEKPFYFHGVDKHEDADFRGKGFDYPTYLKDINVMKWLGVNGIRTSHYPYATEFLEMCDEAGIAVIGESTAVGLMQKDNFVNVTLAHHLEVMKEMIGRDKNHPSVVMWSVANEPDSSVEAAVPYFQTVAEQTRLLDPNRPITFACSHDYNSDKATQFFDVVMINRYYAWYEEPGHLELIEPFLSNDLENWRDVRKMPILISEYGAGTISGLHVNPPMEFTEDYQMQFHASYFKAFDKYRGKFLIGELIWNFADFMTDQGTNRVWGNRKGILNRQRQPKPAAYLVRDRYWTLAQGGPPEDNKLMRFICKI